MKNIKNYILATLSLTMLLSVTASAVPAKALDLNYPQMVEVLKLAKAINAVNPRLDDSKYIEYAVGIYRASQKYGVESKVLIAITQQETGFRENLPEGAAGEIGICQIRKMWLKNPKFKAEFKKQAIRDMMKPSKSFLFAAWILKQLKDSVAESSLPYWSFYNAVRFNPRFKYFLAVNRNIATLRRHEPSEMEPVLAANEPKPEVVEATDPEATQEVPAAWKPQAKKVEAEKPVAVPTPKVVTLASAEMVPTRWIPEALRKIAKQQKIEDNKKSISPSMARAAAELEVSPWESPRSMQD